MSARKLDALYAEYAAAKGNEKERAKDKLIRALYQDAYPIMYHKLRAYHPDIITDSVAMAAVYLDTFRGEARFSTWFYGIVVNFCNRYLRQAITRNEVSLEELLEVKGESAEPIAPESNQDVTLDLAWLLEGLDPEEQKMLRLKAEGKSHEEIGVALGGVPKKTIDTRIRRLRLRLGEKVNAGRESD